MVVWEWGEIAIGVVREEAVANIFFCFCGVSRGLCVGRVGAMRECVKVEAGVCGMDGVCLWDSGRFMDVI